MFPPGPPQAQPPPSPMEEVEQEAPPPTSAATSGYAPETVNLAEQMSEEDLKTMAARVIANVERDRKSSERFREQRANIVKLYLGMLPPLPDGEQRARVHYAIIATAINRMHARIYDQQFPSNGEYFGIRPTDATDLERSVRVAKHMNWQILHQIPEYVPNHDALIMQWLLYGSAFTFVYWNPLEKRICHEVCETEDIILPYNRSRGKRDPSMANIPRITRVLRYYQHELEEMQDNGYYTNVDKLYEDDGKSADGQGPASSMPDNRSQPMQEVIDRQQGQEKPADDPDAPRVLFEQHCWWKLPGEEKKRPVIITVDEQKQLVLCVKLREDEDPQDRARYNREAKVNEASYAAAMQQYQMDLAQYYAGQTQAPMMGMPMEEMGEPPAMNTQAEEMGEPTMTQPPTPGATDMTAPGVPPPMAVPPPMPPSKPPEPDQPKMVPINFFTHYICIPNPEGVYGFGIGYLLEGHNIVADTVASQILDAGTIANAPPGLLNRQSKMKRGEIRYRPGEFTEVDTVDGDVRKAATLLPFPPPNPAMGQIIKDQKEEASEVSGSNEILSGEVGGSNETATTTQIRISQALAAISILNKRYTRSRTVEGQKIARLNSVHLTDAEYFTVVDPFKRVPTAAAMGGMPVPEYMPPDVSVPEPMQVSRMDYLEDVDITVTADPRMSSQPQRFQEALQAFNLIMGSPALAMNPILVQASARNLFVAMDRPELVAALSAVPPMPPMMGGPPPGGPPGKPPNGKPSPKPGPSVPNGGPAPTNEPFMGQGQ